MNDDPRLNKERDPILLRLELHLNGNDLEDGNVTIQRLTEVDPDHGAELSEQDLTELACRIYESRRLRARYLSMSLLGEPVWDMMLALYCFSTRGRRMSVSSLCYASGVPQTTAMRWIGVMEKRDLVKRSKDLRDGRKTYLLLTEQGKNAMQRYLRGIHDSLRGERSG